MKQNQIVKLKHTPATAPATATRPASDTVPLLTIAIPTYNRAGYLGYLLSNLVDELTGIEPHVEIRVFDNASTDDTPSVVQKHSLLLPNFSAYRHQENLGADTNILNCFRNSHTPYVWILGDDDIPVKGAIRALFKELAYHQPDLVYLNSISTWNLRQEHANRQLEQVFPLRVSREKFADIAHVRMTFISAIIFRKTENSKGVEHIARSLINSSLIQLSWIYERLAYGEKFLYVRERSVIATADNRGGYLALEVFIQGHALIAQRLLQNNPTIIENIISKTSSCHLPLLIWNIRNGNAGAFALPPLDQFGMPSSVYKRWSFFFFIRPIWTWPMPIAKLVSFGARLFAKCVSSIDQLILMKRT